MILEVSMSEQDTDLIRGPLDLANIQHSTNVKTCRFKVEGSEEDLRYFVRLLETRKIHYTIHKLDGKELLYSTD
jgi:uncharacterized protein involved in type VI secretion and phage assembly